MMKKLLFFLVFVLLIRDRIPAQVKLWPEVTKEMRPWTRWWWMGSAVDEKNLDRLLTAYQQAGFGGMEITPIYGAKGYENRYVKFLSPQWMQFLGFTVKKATSLGMGIDMNTGTGWPFGGPQIPKELAAGKLIIQSYPVKGEQIFSKKLVLNDTAQLRLGALLQAVTAVNEKGDRISLLKSVDQNQQLNWKVPSGNWTIYAAFSGKTGQQVKRAAPGGEGYVMDHYSGTAVSTYLKRFTDAFNNKPVSIHNFFNDSYEVYFANWTPGFFSRFQKIKGYDLRLYVRELMQEGDDETIARIKSDYNEVLGLILKDDFTAQWTQWAHSMKAKARNQAHGSPGNLLDLYSVPDIPECEGYFGRTSFNIPGLAVDAMDKRDSSEEHNPVMFKFASSAAHFYKKPLTSSETFVWLTEHFRTALAQCKPEVEQLFLAGINHVYYHGSTYSPEDVAWPGWTFYASSNFVPANTTWSHLKGMNEYITRCQSVLQSGQPDNQLLVYWPVYDQWNNKDGLEKRFTVHDIGKWLNPAPFNSLVTELENKGFSTDFVSDKMIETLLKTSKPGIPKVLIIPACSFMPAATLSNIIELAKIGTKVIFQRLPGDVPGYAGWNKNQEKFRALIAQLAFNNTGQALQHKKMGTGDIYLASAVPEALNAANVEREELTDIGLKFIRRDVNGNKYYYVVNHSAKKIDAFIPLNVKPGVAIIMDPQDGHVGKAATNTQGNKMNIRLQMQPGEALFIRTYSDDSPSIPGWNYFDPSVVKVLHNPWLLHFTEGGPVLPKDQNLTELGSWTRFGDAAAESFAGSGVYTTSFTMDSLTGSEYLLQLGEVRESAHVWINGSDVGIMWSIPFQKRIKQFLKPGVNTLKIEVSNLMANRVRDMDIKGIKWRNYHEINFVNIQYQPFDASGWKPLDSGLIGPVTITAEVAGK